jgi:RNA polymerase sigma-70 factor (ECF subfamily)
MTGSAADADDAVQETFARALERPPPDLERPLWPWLVRVATNLCRDVLRRRRRRGYVGVWLPTPVDTSARLGDPPEPVEPAAGERRYEWLESLSFAFLVALEQLSPAQRAVLLLRDALDYSTADAADALDMSEANVRTTLHRARRVMASYDASRCPPSPAVCEQTGALLRRFLGSVAVGDIDAIAALLTAGVVAVNDGGGHYAAARIPVLGRRRVARFHVRIGRAEPPRLVPCELNGLPAVVGQFASHRPHLAPRFALLLLPAPCGRIAALHTIVSPDKLAALAQL